MYDEYYLDYKNVDTISSNEYSSVTYKADTANEYKDVGQRALLSVPPNTASKTVGYYRKCMLRRGYLLRAK